MGILRTVISLPILIAMLILAQAATATVVLDVRTPEEFREAHLVGAQLLDFYSPEFSQKLATLNRSSKYVVYCRSGGRSAKAVKMMREMGFRDVTDAGGLREAASLTRISCTGPKGC